MGENNNEIVSKLLNVGFGFYSNEITQEVEKYLLKDFEHLPTKSIVYKTYIIGRKKNKNVFYIRFFGATRGRIIVNDEFQIKKIEINKTNGYENDDAKFACYSKEVLNIIDKYVGKTLIFKNERININGK